METTEVPEIASVVEGTIPLEGTIDKEDTNDEISTAFTAAVSATGVLGAWHSGCRGPSPLVEAWMSLDTHLAKPRGTVKDSPQEPGARRQGSAPRATRQSG